MSLYCCMRREGDTCGNLAFRRHLESEYGAICEECFYLYARRHGIERARTLFPTIGVRPQRKRYVPPPRQRTWHDLVMRHDD